MRAPKKTPPAATEGAEEKHVESDELSAAWLLPHEAAPTNANPSGLRRPPGLVGDIADYIYASSKRPLLEASMLAALGLVAGIAGRCYNIEGDGLNLYMLLLAPTGYGKSAMAKGIDRLVTEVRTTGVAMVDTFIGPAEFASGAGMHNEVADNPSVICLFGEFGYKLRAMSSPRANEHEQAQLRLLLDLYNKSGRYDELRARRYADKVKSTKSVRSPALSILCESTPETIYESLSPELIRNGLLPRFIVCESTGRRSKKNRHTNIEPPAALLAGLRDLVAKAAQSKSIGADMQPAYHDVHMDVEASAYLNEIEEDLDEIYLEANPVERELWNRALQNIYRVAALLAVGINIHNPVITHECARWAVDFVYASVHNLVERFDEGLVGHGDSRQEAELKRFIRDYLAMPESDRLYSSYRVPKELARDRTTIGLDYLRRRARQVTAFTSDRRGYRIALDAALKGLVDTGLLFEIKPHVAEREFGLRSIVYRVYREDLLG